MCVGGSLWARACAEVGCSACHAASIACDCRWKALDFHNGRTVAWNEVSVAGYVRKDLDRLVNEVRLLKTLNHKNLIKFFGIWDVPDKGKLVFITDFMHSGTIKECVDACTDGASKPSSGCAGLPSGCCGLERPDALAEFARRCVGQHHHAHASRRFRQKYPVTRSKIKEWCRAILECLQYLHSEETAGKAKIIHRDLKCDNIFVSSEAKNIKVGDLGLATTDGRSAMGTPEFMAPDMFSGNYDTSVDIHSFGMCLLEMVTGEVPYAECGSFAKISDKIMSRTLPESIQALKVAWPEAYDFFILCVLGVRPRTQPPAAEAESSAEVGDESGDLAPLREPAARPTAGELLADSFFEPRDDDNTDTDAMMQLVEEAGIVIPRPPTKARPMPPPPQPADDVEAPASPGVEASGTPEAAAHTPKTEPPSKEEGALETAGQGSQTSTEASAQHASQVGVFAVDDGGSEADLIAGSEADGPVGVCAPTGSQDATPLVPAISPAGKDAGDESSAADLSTEARKPATPAQVVYTTEGLPPPRTPQPQTDPPGEGSPLPDGVPAVTPAPAKSRQGSSASPSVGDGGSTQVTPGIAAAASAVGIPDRTSTTRGAAGSDSGSAEHGHPAAVSEWHVTHSPAAPTAPVDASGQGLPAGTALPGQEAATSQAAVHSTTPMVDVAAFQALQAEVKLLRSQMTEMHGRMAEMAAALRHVAGQSAEWGAGKLPGASDTAQPAAPAAWRVPGKPLAEQPLGKVLPGLPVAAGSAKDAQPSRLHASAAKGPALTSAGEHSDTSTPRYRLFVLEEDGEDAATAVVEDALVKEAHALASEVHPEEATALDLAPEELLGGQPSPASAAGQSFVRSRDAILAIFRQDVQQEYTRTRAKLVNMEAAHGKVQDETDKEREAELKKHEKKMLELNARSCKLEEEKHQGAQAEELSSQLAALSDLPAMPADRPARGERGASDKARKEMRVVKTKAEMMERKVRLHKDQEIAEAARHKKIMDDLAVRHARKLKSSVTKRESLISSRQAGVENAVRRLHQQLRQALAEHSGYSATPAQPGSQRAAHIPSAFPTDTAPARANTPTLRHNTSAGSLAAAPGTAATSRPHSSSVGMAPPSAAPPSGGPGPVPRRPDSASGRISVTSSIQRMAATPVPDIRAPAAQPVATATLAPAR